MPYILAYIFSLRHMNEIMPCKYPSKYSNLHKFEALDINYMKKIFYSFIKLFNKREGYYLNSCFKRQFNKNTWLHEWTLSLKPTIVLMFSHLFLLTSMNFMPTQYTLAHLVEYSKLEYDRIFSLFVLTTRNMKSFWIMLCLHPKNWQGKHEMNAQKALVVNKKVCK